MAFDRIAVVGAGAWGCALANAIARAGASPMLLGHAATAAVADRHRAAGARARGCRE